MMIHECFSVLEREDGEVEGTADQRKETGGRATAKTTDREGPSVASCYEFLEMIYRIMPTDMAKLRRITLEKTVPNLIQLSDEIEEVTQKRHRQFSAATNTVEMQEQMLVEARKLRKLEKKAQLYMRELLMSKVIADFKLRFQLASGVTSSSSSREISMELLPFLMELHDYLPNRLTRALATVI